MFFQADRESGSLEKSCFAKKKKKIYLRLKRENPGVKVLESHVIVTKRKKLGI